MFDGSAVGIEYHCVFLSDLRNWNLELGKSLKPCSLQQSYAVGRTLCRPHHLRLTTSTLKFSFWRLASSTRRKSRPFRRLLQAPNRPTLTIKNSHFSSKNSPDLTRSCKKSHNKLLRLIHITVFSACLCSRWLRFFREIENFLYLHWCSPLWKTQTAASSVNQPLQWYVTCQS